jgi:hypothetical protein
VQYVWDPKTQANVYKQTSSKAFKFLINNAGAVAETATRWSYASLAEDASSANI